MLAINTENNEDDNPQPKPVKNIDNSNQQNNCTK